MFKGSKFKKATLFVTTVSLLTLTIAFGVQRRCAAQGGGNDYESIELFTDVLSIVKKSYVEEVDTKGAFGGLGIEITIKDGILTVISPIEDTPAFKAGIKAGDQILKIDDKFTKDLNINDAVKRMRGQKGTKVILTIMREGFDKPKEFP